MQMVQFRKLHRETLFNPLHPKIIMHIFHTVLRTFAMKLTKRILTQMTQVYFFKRYFQVIRNASIVARVSLGIVIMRNQKNCFSL